MAFNIEDLTTLASLLGGAAQPAQAPAAAVATPAAAPAVAPAVAAPQAVPLPANAPADATGAAVPNAPLTPEGGSFDLASALSNPDILKFMAQAGAGLSDPGSFGQVAGDATKGWIESAQMRKALSALTAGKKPVTPAGTPGPTEIKATPDGDVITKETPAGVAPIQTQQPANAGVPGTPAPAPTTATIAGGAPDPFLEALRRSLA